MARLRRAASAPSPGGQVGPVRLLQPATGLPGLGRQGGARFRRQRGTASAQSRLRNTPRRLLLPRCYTGSPGRWAREISRGPLGSLQPLQLFFQPRRRRRPADPGRGGRVRRDPGLFRLHAHGPGGDERSGRATANTSRAGRRAGLHIH